MNEQPNVRFDVGLIVISLMAKENPYFRFFIKEEEPFVLRYELKKEVRSMLDVMTKKISGSQSADKKVFARMYFPKGIEYDEEDNIIYMELADVTYSFKLKRA